MPLSARENSGGLFGLGASYLRVPERLGFVSLDDAIDTRYTFAVYRIRDLVSGVNAVYAFASAKPDAMYINYIGKADILRQRLSSHDRIDEAVTMGADHLLVHIPTPYDRIGHEKAEKRLIKRYLPPMNKQHAPSLGLSELLLGVGIR